MTITNHNALSITDQNNLPFSAKEYCLFKYGSKSIAKKFGTILADSFIKNNDLLALSKKPIVVIPSAFSHIVTASFHIQTRFANLLNNELNNLEKSPVEFTKIYRNVTYRVDYGKMNAKQRFDLIANDYFYIDPNFVKGKNLIFIDDIRVTGTHEKIIVRMLNQLGIDEQVHFLCLASVDSDKIDPKIEHYLNDNALMGLKTIEELVCQDDFIFNTRVVKYILSRSREEFREVVGRQSKQWIEELYYLAIGNEYQMFEEYQENLEWAKSITLRDLTI